MAVARWSPFQELEAVDRRLRRLFDETSAVPGLPNADVYETEDEYVVELEVPGFEEKDLAVEVTDHTLMVKGERTEVKKEAKKHFRLHERLEASFERRFALPTEVDAETLKASFGKGVLEVHAGKTKEAARKKVAIAHR